MGGTLSHCPEPVSSLLTYSGLASAGSNHPSGIIVKGVEYSTVKLVGEGGYAYVYEGVCNATGQTVALKRYVFVDASQEHRTQEEMKIYQSVCPFENVVNYVDSEAVHRPRAPLPEVWVVMEYCEGPSLQNYINNRLSMAQSFAIREVYEILDNIIHAIGHLHSQSPPVSHWDVKPDNFLFAETGVLKLCDFGSATCKYYAPQTADDVSIAEAELGARMTLLYRSPESLDLWSKKRVDHKADIWALGVLTYVLIYREMPFEASVLEIVDGVAKKFRAGEDDSTPEEFKALRDIVRTNMLVKDPSRRADVFTLSEELSKINHLTPLERPRAGIQSPQLPRFSGSG